MLINLKKLVRKYNLTITGIIHVGAHECEEYDIYKEIGIRDKKMIWVEGNIDIVNKMKGIFCNIYQGLVSDTEEDVEFIITNEDQSSSLFELEEHKKEHPGIIEEKRIVLKTITLNTLFKNNNIDYKNYNFINLDIQGAELKALKGMDISYIDYIYSEVNSRHLYKNCPLINDIDKFLVINNDFKRVETKMTVHGWGDAFYIRKNKINKNVFWFLNKETYLLTKKKLLRRISRLLQ